MKYVKNFQDYDVTLQDLGLSIPAGGAVDLDVSFKEYEVGKSNDLLKSVSSGILIINDGKNDLNATEAINFLTAKMILPGPVDRWGKMRTHASPRPLGASIYFSGCSDSDLNSKKVGDGTRSYLKHSIGDPLDQAYYIDFNLIENDSWISEGIIVYKNATFDFVGLEIVPRVITYEVGTNTTFNLYGGYLIIPAAGNGTINITSDITLLNGGLVQMVPDDLGNISGGYWDATWNSVTQRFENITPNPYGKGKFNMFTVEVTLAKFACHLSLAGEGQMPLRSSDTSQLGQNMRLKVKTSTFGPDHDWEVASIMTLYRKKTV